MPGEGPPRPGKHRTLSLQELALWAMAGGRERIYEKLYATLIKPMTGYFQKKLGLDRSTSEHLGHETLTECFQMLRSGRYDPTKAKFITLVYAIARQTAADHFRRLGRNKEVPLSEIGQIDLMSISEEGPVPLIAEMMEALRECLQTDSTPASLTPVERRIVRARTRGETFEALGRRIDRAPSEAHDRYSAALRKLSRCMANKGYR